MEKSNRTSLTAPASLIDPPSSFASKEEWDSFEASIAGLPADSEEMKTAKRLIAKRRAREPEISRSQRMARWRS